MAAISGANIVNDGLILYVDPSNPVCYSGTGTSVYNLASSSLVGGTLVNGVTYDYANNGAMYFDGTNDYIAIPDSNLLDFGSSFTISAWIKINDLTTAASHCIFNNMNVQTGITTQGLSLMWWRDNLYGVNPKSLMIQYGMNGGAWNVYSSDANTINDLNIHHVVITISAANTNNPTVSFYIDGVLKTTTWWGQSTKAAINYSSDTSTIRVGHLYTPGDPNYANSFANINVYNLQIYKIALSASQITQNYNATKSRFLTSENILTNGLIFSIDASKITSYPGTGTSIYDLSGLSNNGTLVSSPTFSKLNGGSLSFNGNSYITRSSALDAGQNFSVTAWIYPTSLGARNAIVGNGYPYTTDNGWLFCICDNNFSLFQALFLSIGQNNVLKISNSYVFQLNKWSHVSCSVSGGGSSVKFYVNGVETSYGFTIESGRTISYSNNEFHIGMRHSTTGERFAGNISQVQIYNTTLTAQEITQNYNATKNRYINILPPVNDSLVLNLDAGNRASYAGTGTTWFDLSSNRISASLVDGVVFAGTGISTHFSFDGTGDYVNIPSTSLFNFGSGDFSVELAIYYNASTSSDNTYRPAFMLGSGNSYLIMNKWRSGIGNGIVLDYSVAGSRYTLTTTNAVPSPNVNNTITSPLFDVNAKWTHFVIRISSNVMTLYINSVSYGSVNLASRWNTNQGLTIGTGGGDYMSGLIPYFKFYNRALSASEILQNFNFYRSRYGI
jgi:hypothetical protein